MKLLKIALLVAALHSLLSCTDTNGAISGPKSEIPKERICHFTASGAISGDFDCEVSITPNAGNNMLSLYSVTGMRQDDPAIATVTMDMVSVSLLLPQEIKPGILKVVENGSPNGKLKGTAVGMIMNAGKQIKVFNKGTKGTINLVSDFPFTGNFSFSGMGIKGEKVKVDGHFQFSR